LPGLLLLGVCMLFGAMDRRFLDKGNLVSILVNSAASGVVATGMTLVLLVGGVDLSVGALMFLASGVAAKMALAGAPIAAACAVALGIGILFGLLNGVLVARVRLLAFIATLATLYLGRGIGLYITETRAVNLPDRLLTIGTGHLMGIPYPILVLAGVTCIAQLGLTQTKLGRQIYAVGYSPEAAKTAGVSAGRILVLVYALSGLLAALGGLIAVTQLGSVAPTLGEGREFDAIAAAVLGGTSLFGGRGKVLPGTLVGAVLIQTVQCGLVVLNTDPYLYPMVTALIILLAIVVDHVRHISVRRKARRQIRQQSAAA
jgi:ribose transport system permease protein